MNDSWLETIPENSRDAARTAVSAAFGSAPVTSIDAVLGGASGALAYRVAMDGRPYLLRIEARRSPMRNPHQYVCMKIAADAGIAPPLRYADDSTGVAILDFVITRPLHEYPGGPAGLAAAIGKLAAGLQSTPSFPTLGDYRVLIDRMFGYLKPFFAPGLLDPHLSTFARIREAYRWTPSEHVSSHNDPNPGNVLFDGERLWMIDWETSYRNDRLTDLAILTKNHASSPELEEILLRSWLGHPPDRVLRARLALMRHMTQLYYAGIVLAFSAAKLAPIADLSVPTPEEIRSLVASGQPKIGAPETMLTFGKACLAGFLAGTNRPDFEDNLGIARLG